MAQPATPSIKLCSLDRFKDFIKETESSNDTTLNTLIDRASSMIEGATGRQFKSQTYTDELYDGTGSSELWLRQYPVTSITSASYWQTGTTFQSYSNVSTQVSYDDSDEDNGRGSGFIFWRDGTVWYLGRRNIKITYAAGFATASNSLPEDLQHAAVLMTHVLYQQRESGLHLAPSLTVVDGQTITFRDQPIPTAVQVVIEKYKRYSRWYG